MLGHSHMLVGVSGLVIGEAAAHAAGIPLADAAQIGALPVPGVGLMVVATAVGALAPDIDHPNAFLANFKFGGAWIGALAGVLGGSYLATQPGFAASKDMLPALGLAAGILLGHWLLRGLRFRALKEFATVANEVAGHRKFFHSIVATILFGALALLWLSQAGLPFVALAFAWGYCSHLVADSMTRSGVPWLWPKLTPYGIPRALRFTTGTPAEYLAVALWVAAAIVAVVSWVLPRA